METNKYKCFICTQKFKEITETIVHLRKFHNIRDKNNAHVIRCIANSNCKNVYQTFDGLRRHLKKCKLLDVEIEVRFCDILYTQIILYCKFFL